MSVLTKDFYRQELNFAKQELEKTLDMFGLNQTQRQKLRELVDRVVEAQRKEYNAPEKDDSK